VSAEPNLSFYTYVLLSSIYTGSGGWLLVVAWEVARDPSGVQTSLSAW